MSQAAGLMTLAVAFVTDVTILSTATVWQEKDVMSHSGTTPRGAESLVVSLMGVLLLNTKEGVIETLVFSMVPHNHLCIIICLEITLEYVTIPRTIFSGIAKYVLV